jgi:PAS domain S-box-containing protein
MQPRRFTALHPSPGSATEDPARLRVVACEPGEVGYLEVDAKGRVSFVSRRALEVLGFSGADIAAIEAGGPADLDERLFAATSARMADPRAFRAAAKRERSLPPCATSQELALLDGRTIEFHAAPLRDPGGVITGRALFLTDVSARRRAQLELGGRARQQETVAELGELAMNAEDPQPLLRLAARLVASTLDVDLVHLLELRGRELLVRACNVDEGGLGYVPLTADATSMSGFTLQNQAPVVSADLAAERRFEAPRLRALGVTSAVSVVVRGRDQPFGVLGAQARHRRVFTDEEVHFLETVANILAAMLARHAAEAALLVRERQLRAVFENALDALCTLDDEGRLVEVNAAACRLHGRTRGDLIGREVFPMLALSRAAAAAAFQHLRREGTLRGEFEIVPPGPGRSPRQVELSAVADILPGLHLGIMRDVTEQRSMQARLALSDRMASVGTLAAGVAHELNNPLSYVTANLAFVAEGIRRGVGPGDEGEIRAELLDAVGEARDGAERMRDIIRDLKTFSRADETRSGAVELTVVLESCISMAWNEIRHRARLVRALEHVPSVHGNEARLGQVFLNLLVNAAQAIPEGAADRNTITVATRLLGDGRVVVEFRDTGSGIAPEHRARIFDPFFTTKPLGVGTGLGLSICHNIVASLGGDIEVESEPGAGSTFRVVLQRWGGAPQGTRPAPHARPSPARRGRVLVVDDEPLVGNAVRRTLSAEHDVVVVAGAREALALVEAGERFDLIVSDLHMPDMTGIELRDGLEALAPELAGRMIFVTGGAFTQSSREFVEANHAICLEKPFELAALRDLVQRRMPPA